MDILAFSNNWNNKLGCDFFTTLRLSGRFEKGQRVEIWLGETNLGIAEIRDKRSLKIEHINDFIAGIDTGYPPQETIEILKQMYKGKAVDWDTQPIYLYLVKYTDEVLKARKEAKKLKSNQPCTTK